MPALWHAGCVVWGSIIIPLSLSFLIWTRGLIRMLTSWVCLGIQWDMSFKAVNIDPDTFSMFNKWWLFAGPWRGRGGQNVGSKVGSGHRTWGWRGSRGQSIIWDWIILLVHGKPLKSFKLGCPAITTLECHTLQRLEILSLLPDPQSWIHSWHRRKVLLSTN